MKPFAHLKYAALSDIGKKRKNNEDAFGMFPGSGIFCVADGMGGGDDGEIASAAVVRTVEDLAARMKPDESGGVCADDVGNGLAAALSTVSAWICNRAHERKLNGCGSTFVGVIFDPTNPAQALAVHAGDSRLYLLHRNTPRQITRDHSVAELMGEKDESKVNPMFRSMVVNGIGIRDKAEPEFTPFKIAPGDRVLLCSDGLSRMVPDKRIASIVRAEESPDKAVSALIAAALDAGGVDNVTAVLVQVGEFPPPLTPRKPLPPPQPPEEAETENGDNPTTSDDTGKTDETRTCVTQFSGIAEADAFDIETPSPAVGSSAAKPPRPCISRRTLWLVLTVSLIAIVCGILALFWGQRRSDSRTSEAGKAPATSGTGATSGTVATSGTGGKTENAVAVDSRPPESVNSRSPDGESVNSRPPDGESVNSRPPDGAAVDGRSSEGEGGRVFSRAENTVVPTPPPKAASSAIADGTASLPDVANASSVKTAVPAKPETPIAASTSPSAPPEKQMSGTPSATPEKQTSGTPSATPKAPDYAVEFVSACGDDSVQSFVRTLRRLLPHDDRNADFDKERECFLKSARKLVQRRGRPEAEAAAVDLRVLLQNAEAARASPVLQKARTDEKSVLSVWDDVLNGNPADVATQMSCARLIKTFKDLR